VLSKDLPFGMVADDPDIDEAAQVELLCSKHRHLVFDGRDDSFFVQISSKSFVAVKSW
jgi:hypothetical protein